MRRVVAQFKLPWRPGRALLAALALLTALVILLGCAPGLLTRYL